MLEGMGCSVDLAEDGEEAMEAAFLMPYDVIMMDIHMPKMDGAEAAAAIRSRGGPNAGTPIIAVTADVMLNISAAPYAGLFAGVVTKPYTSETLRQGIAGLFSKTRNAAADTDNAAGTDIGDGQYIARAIVNDLVRQLGADETGEILGDIGIELDALTGLLENASSDNAVLARAAHKAAGSMGAAGLVAIASVLRKIESCAKAGESEETAELVAALGDMVPPARNELDNLIRDIRSHE